LNGQKTIDKLEEVEALLHSAIDIDQVIMLESESLADSLTEGSKDYAKNMKILSRISSFAEENSEKIKKVRNLNRDMQ
jgi:hypothetical protein